MTTLKTFKAFNKDWTCRGFQYKVGETYTHEGAVKACESGFHSCQYPLDIFNYYNPCSSVFAEVESSGLISKEDSDSKVAAETILIKRQLDLPDLIQEAIKYTTGNCVNDGSQHSTGDRAASSATGNRAASSATGDQAASSATGNQAASSATGNRAASSATGDQAASSATGNQAASSATGYQAASSATGDQAASSATGNQAASSATGNRAASSATGDQAASLTTGYYSSSESTNTTDNLIYASAIATGYQGKVRGTLGDALFLVERDEGGVILNVWAGIVGQKKIKPNTWYTLKDGKPTIVENSDE